jgi:hypothetical protein
MADPYLQELAWLVRGACAKSTDGRQQPELYHDGKVKQCPQSKENGFF